MTKVIPRYPEINGRLENVPAAWSQLIRILTYKDSIPIDPTSLNGLPKVVNTTSYVVQSSDGLVLVDASAAPATVNLPSAQQQRSRIIRVKKTDSSGNSVTIAAAGSETIDGSSTSTLASQYDTKSVYSDGINWWIVV